MGGKKKNAKTAAVAKEAVKEDVSVEGVHGEAKKEMQDVVNRLAVAAKLDGMTLAEETADQVRERLGKSQAVARNIMRTLKLERQYCMDLEALLTEHNIPLPDRPMPAEEQQVVAPSLK